jgi:hypothetical protein
MIANLYPDQIRHDDKNVTEAVESIEKTAGVEE